MKYWVLFLLCSACKGGMETQQRLRPSYNYALIQKINGEIGEHVCERNGDGYCYMGKNFYKTYQEVMNETDDMSHKYAYEIYKQQRMKLGKFNNDEQNMKTTQKESVVDTSLKNNRLKNDEVIITNDEFAVKV